jgi:hypothetical protein
MWRNIILQTLLDGCHILLAKCQSLLEKFINIHLSLVFFGSYHSTVISLCILLFELSEYRGAPLQR